MLPSPMQSPLAVLAMLAAALLPAAPSHAQAETPAFDAQAFARTEQDPGEFPYVSIPAGFRDGGAKRLSLAEKYVFPKGELHVATGAYWHADVFADGGEWNELLFLRGIEQQVSQLGGHRVFDGSMPDAGRKMIDENAPAFARDLYDPAPYRFRQFLIHAEDRLIWIEIGYGYNAEMIDLTVIEEEIAA